MKRCIINTANIDLSTFGDLAFAYGNECCTEKFEVIVPNENPAYAYHYFFGVRHCMDEEYRLKMDLEDSVAEAIRPFRDAAENYAEHDMSCADNDKRYNEVMAIVRRLEKIGEMAEELTSKLEEYGITKEGIVVK